MKKRTNASTRTRSSKSPRSSSKPKKARTGAAHTATESSVRQTVAARTAEAPRPKLYLRKWNGRNWLWHAGPFNTQAELDAAIAETKNGHHARFATFVGRKMHREFYSGAKAALPYFV